MKNLEVMLDGAVVEYFKVLLWNSPRATEKNHINMIRLAHIVKSVINKKYLLSFSPMVR
jgi:hypothetical protein